MFGFVFYDGNVEEAVLEGEDDSIAYLDLVIEFVVVNELSSYLFFLKLTFNIIVL